VGEVVDVAGERVEGRWIVVVIVVVVKPARLADVGWRE